MKVAAETAVEVGFPEYLKRYVETLTYCVERLDGILDERPETDDFEGMAVVSDAISDKSEAVMTAPEQLRHEFHEKLQTALGRDPSDLHLDRIKVRDLIADLVDQAREDGFRTAVNTGRGVLPSLAAQELPSAAEAIALLEEHVWLTTEVTQPHSLKYGTKLARAWFEQQEPATPGASVAPHRRRPERVATDGLISEYPASLCPPVGKTLATGTVGVVEVPGGRRVAVFKTAGRDVRGMPVGQVLEFATNVKPRMGGRLDLADDFYLIIGGGKSAAKRLLHDLTP
jgi:hypothetical protein